ncbi:MAG: hypothetical protein KIC94_14935 [Clostridiales bacterium]|nr:hypothetical protein [Clostridiales bacterium]
MNDNDRIWTNILNHQGEEFHTVRGKTCSYKISGNHIVLLNTNRTIPRSNIEQAITVINPTVSKFNSMNLQGSSYIFAIISDSRIQ